MYIFYISQVQNPHQAPIIPKIHVQNDQYRPPASSYPQYVSQAPPPQQHYAPPPQPEYLYAPPTQPPNQPMYYQPAPQQEAYTPRVAPAPQRTSESYFKTIDNDPYEYQQEMVHHPVKRTSGGLPVRYSTSAASGPLKSRSNKNYVPAVELDGPSPPKKKFTKITGPNESALKRLKEETATVSMAIESTFGFVSYYC